MLKEYTFSPSSQVSLFGVYQFLNQSNAPCCFRKYLYLPSKVVGLYKVVGRGMALLKVFKGMYEDESEVPADQIFFQNILWMHGVCGFYFNWGAQ